MQGIRISASYRKIFEASGIACDLKFKETDKDEDI